MSENLRAGTVAEHTTNTGNYMSLARLFSGLTATAVAASLLLVAPADAETRTASTTTAAEVGWPPAPPTQLVIDTQGQPIGREDYVPGTVTLDGVTRATEVRGRGNSTWGWAKKPYKLKLAEDAALVGTRPFEKWVLLAGYADRSSLRTAVAFAVAAQTRMRWTPRFRFVEVVLNGQPQGLYMLTEQVEVERGRVSLPDDGYLLEINKRYLRDDEPGFRTGRGTPVAFKDPDEVTRRQRRQVRKAVTRFEKVLYSPGFANRKRGYRAHIDVRSVIDWYLVEELLANQDSNFQSSVHLTWTPGGRFVFGPVWDFDQSAGTRWRASWPTDQFYTRLGDHWISRMLEDPAFSSRVKRRWQRLAPVVREVVAQIPDAARTLEPAAAADWEQWHTADDLEWSHHAAGKRGEVEFLQQWLTDRASWLDRNEVRIDTTRLATEERQRTVWVPVRLQRPADRAVELTWNAQPGTAKAGRDFVSGQGTITFAPGQRLRYLPLQILDDRRTERRETVMVNLVASSGAVLGSPHRLTVGIRRNRR